MNLDRSLSRSVLGLAVALLVVAALALPNALGPAKADHKPADKMVAAGSTLEIMTSDVTNGSVSEEATLLTGTLRSSNPTDLVLQLTLECALWTDVTTVGNDDQGAEAQVEVWVEVDGEPVDVSSDDTDGGRAVFCNRAYEVKTLQFDDEDATIERYLRTRSANAFNWVTLNVGSGIHEITVKAQLDASASDNARAKAAIGDRTLVVEPVKMANDASV